MRIDLRTPAICVTHAFVSIHMTKMLFERDLIYLLLLPLLFTDVLSSTYVACLMMHSIAK